MKPVRGGRPPRESKVSGIRDVKIGAFVQEMAREVMLVAFTRINVRNTEDVIIRYTTRVKKVREDEN